MDRFWIKSYQKGVPADIDVESCNSIVDLLDKGFADFADLPAYANLGKVLSYRDTERLSRNLAAFFQKRLKLAKGDRIAIMMPNLLQYPVALFGALRGGYTVVNVNPLYTARELEHQLVDSGAKAIVILANFAHVLQKVLPKTQVKHVIITQIGDLLPPLKGMLINFIVRRVKKMVPAYSIAGAIRFKKALAEGQNFPHDRPQIAATDLAFMQYTGGTTGVAKGAMLTHRNISANVQQALAWIGRDLKSGEEIILTPLPLYHIFALTANCFTYFLLGALNVLITNPRDLAKFIAEMKRWPFSCLTGVNTLFNGLLNHPDFAQVDFRHLKLTLGGGMAVQRPVAERWQELTKSPLIEAYGLTETSPAACINPLDLPGYNGYIGLPISSTEVTIRDDEGRELPLGEAGELCVRGPQVMAGYWQRPEETANVFWPDGWLKTGDVAVMNEDGYLKIVDRKKDMILVSGFNVYPNEIEDVAVAHPGVVEAAAIGVPDDKCTERVKLFVVKKQPDLTAEELMVYFRENLTGYKCPKHIEFRDELPKTNVGKILRRALRE